MELKQAKEDSERLANDFQREKEGIINRARKAAEADLHKALKDLEESHLAARRLDKKLRDKVLLLYSIFPSQ